MSQESLLKHDGCSFQMVAIDIDTLAEFATRYGLTPISVTSTEPFLEDTQRLAAWQKSGFAGEMGYMRRPAAGYGDLLALMPSSRSIVSFAALYSHGERCVSRHGYGRVARYAWGRDYHRLLRRRLVSLIKELRRFIPDLKARPFVDAAPILERAVASRGGLGFIGKNSLLIRPGIGSFFLLTEILWNVEVTGNVPRSGGSCGECSRCAPACPTGAIVDSYTVDARRCISYLTIEKSGVLTLQEREMVGDWILGCDLCQEVCPFNHRALVTQVGAVRREFSPKEFIFNGGILLDTILSMRSDDDFFKVFSGTPFMRPHREGTVRNALIVAGNQCYLSAAPLIVQAITEDSSPVVRAHALAACWKLKKAGSVITDAQWSRLLNQALRDPAVEVGAEAQLIFTEGGQ